MIGLRDLTFSYRRVAQPVIEGLTYAFEPGAITAVTGASGRGKSTLLYLLGLMMTPRSGTVVLEGNDVSGLPDGERSRLRAAHIGFVFQDAVLDPSRTVLDNVIEGARYAPVDLTGARRRALELLAAIGVEHRADHLPGEVSGGQAQRVALCRALVKRPTVLLADEPSGNLDPVSADVVWEVLAAEARTGSTVVVATHDPARAASCDARLVL